jgi:hypothetical protein
VLTGLRELDFGGREGLGYLTGASSAAAAAADSLESARPQQAAPRVVCWEVRQLLQDRDVLPGMRHNSSSFWQTLFAEALL